MSETIRPVLAGQKALVVGVANQNSIAYGCAKAFALEAIFEQIAGGEGPEHAPVFAAGDAKRQVPASRRKIDGPEDDRGD